MKKLFTKFLSFLLVACFALTVAFGCANSSSQNKNQMKEVYNTYVSYSKEKGETPLSYEEWLASIKGEKGDPGKDGKDGAVPFIGTNGNWYINGKDSGYPARGKEGKATTISINDEGYWVLDGVPTEHKATGTSTGSSSDVLSLLETFFNIENDKFVCESETLQNPSWNYTNSTFSGWGGSIGRVEEIEALSITLRARDTAITKIRFFLTENDKDGSLIASETLDVNVPKYESAEIVWKLPTKITNNTKSLFLSYNCDQMCDVWTSFGAGSEIKSSDYQAVIAYTTDGKMHDSASTMRLKSGGDKCYLYVKIGSLQKVLTPKQELGTAVSNKINVFLPDEYDIAVNDNFQLFYRGVVQAVNPYNYDISITCSKGAEYPRYFEWTPEEADVGKSYSLTLTVRDDNGNVLGEDVTKLNVHKPKTSDVQKQNVLCIGDSLTQRGFWTKEAYRRFTQTGGTPAGLGLNYLNFIGTCTRSVNGNTVGYEGHSGKHWKWFCESDSPFYDSSINDISFKSYCTKNGFEDIDIVYFLLTWNHQGTAYNNNFGFDTEHFVYATKMIDTLHKEYPNAIIRCMGIQMPSQCGGMGFMYGSAGGYSNDYGMLVSAMNYNAALEDFCQQAKYKDFVKYVDVAGQFDTDYNMPASSKPVNNRSEVTEMIGTDGVHPTENGFYQIADAAFRSLCEVFS